MLYTFEENLQSDQFLNGYAWIFNLFYGEETGYGVGVNEEDEAATSLIINSMAVNQVRQLLNIDIEFKFINKKDKLDLIVGDKTDNFDKPVVKKYQMALLSILSLRFIIISSRRHYTNCTESLCATISMIDLA